MGPMESGGGGAPGVRVRAGRQLFTAALRRLRTFIRSAAVARRDGLRPGEPVALALPRRMDNWSESNVARNARGGVALRLMASDLNSDRAPKVVEATTSR